jgi:hypothetical protein
MRIESTGLDMMKEPVFPHGIRHTCRKGVGVHETNYTHFQAAIRHSPGVLI